MRQWQCGEGDRIKMINVGCSNATVECGGEYSYYFLGRVRKWFAGGNITQKSKIRAKIKKFIIISIVVDHIEQKKYVVHSRCRVIRIGTLTTTILFSLELVFRRGWLVMSQERERERELFLACPRDAIMNSSIRMKNAVYVIKDGTQHNQFNFTQLQIKRHSTNDQILHVQINNLVFSFSWCRRSLCFCVHFYLE